MERLTEWSYLAGVMVGDLKAGVDDRKAFDRLAAYEDTGLEPEEIYRERFLIAARKDPEKLARLRELADADMDGRLVVLPCKVGDFLYEVDIPKYGVITCKVSEIHTYFGPLGHAKGNPMVSTAAVSVEVVDGHGKGSGYTFETPDFGKNVFLTREEAEAELKKREEADNEAD